MNKREIFFEKRRAVSPVIATVLLITLVIVTGVVVFLWFRGFVGETITKSGKNIELVCDDVVFSASYSGGNLYISNDGNVPIFGMKLKVSTAGSYETKDLSEMTDGWPDDGLKQGGAFSGLLSGVSGSEDSIILIPVLMGSSESGEKTFVCDEKRHGYEVIA